MVSSCPSSNPLLRPHPWSYTCPNGLYTSSVDSVVSQMGVVSLAGDTKVEMLELVELVVKELVEEM